MQLRCDGDGERGDGEEGIAELGLFHSSRVRGLIAGSVFEKSFLVDLRLGIAGRGGRQKDCLVRRSVAGESLNLIAALLLSRV